MIRIKKDDLSITVTVGAYESIFRPQGFIPADMLDPATEFAEAQTDRSLTASGSLEEERAEHEEQAEESGYEPEAETVDEDLLEKPLANMKLEELKRYAELRKIDIKGLTRKEEIKAAIKSQGGA